MYKKLLTIMLSFVMVLSLGFQGYASAASCGDSGSPKGQVLQGIGQTGSNCDDSGVQNAVNAAVQVLSIVAGMAAVIAIILSGFKYITSGGDSSKVSSAKSALIYALVGFVVAALAQVLVNFVLSSAAGQCDAKGSKNLSANDPKCK